MDEKRIVVAVESGIVDEVLKRWQEKLARRRCPLDARKHHAQVVGSVTVLRYDWIPITDNELYELVNIIEVLNSPYEIVVIGREDLGDVKRWLSVNTNRLPIRLEPHVTVTVEQAPRE